MSYQSAIVAVHDYGREQIGGLPKGGILVAAEPEEGEISVFERLVGWGFNDLNEMCDYVDNRYIVQWLASGSMPLMHLQFAYGICSIQPLYHSRR